MRRPQLKCQLLLAVLCLATPLARAQSPGGDSPDGGGPQFGDHGPGPGFGGNGRPRHGGGLMMHGGFQLGPPGRWWDDRGFAQSLGLRPDQKDKMDGIFNANKPAIVQRFQALRQEEGRMEDLSHQPQIDEAAVFAAIDRVTQARAALEKAHAHTLLLLRQSLDATQLERLEQQRQR